MDGKKRRREAATSLLMRLGDVVERSFDTDASLWYLQTREEKGEGGSMKIEGSCHRGLVKGLIEI